MARTGSDVAERTRATSFARRPNRGPDLRAAGRGAGFGRADGGGGPISDVASRPLGSPTVSMTGILAPMRREPVCRPQGGGSQPRDRASRRLPRPRGSGPVLPAQPRQPRLPRRNDGGLLHYRGPRRPPHPRPPWLLGSPLYPGPRSTSRSRRGPRFPLIPLNDASATMKNAQRPRRAPREPPGRSGPVPTISRTAAENQTSYPSPVCSLQGVQCDGSTAGKRWSE
jgi:hypothetical protein